MSDGTPHSSTSSNDGGGRGAVHPPATPPPHSETDASAPATERDLLLHNDIGNDNGIMRRDIGEVDGSAGENSDGEWTSAGEETEETVGEDGRPADAGADGEHEQEEENEEEEEGDAFNNDRHHDDNNWHLHHRRHNGGEGVEIGEVVENLEDNEERFDESEAGEEEAEEREEGPTVAVLLCGECRHPIVAAHDIFPEREETAWRDQVYSYELDVFDNERPVWAYSATNPSARRFDLLRVRPSARPAPPPPEEGGGGSPAARSPRTSPLQSSASNNSSIRVGCDGGDGTAQRRLSDSRGAARGVAGGGAAPPGPQREVPLMDVHGKYSGEHSFFRGYDWCYCHCRTCGGFLGWGFRRHDSVVAARRDIAYTSSSSYGRSGSGSGSGSEDAGYHSARSASSADGSETDAEEELPTAASAAAAAAAAAVSPEASAILPDFVGLIVTHCTGDAEYPLRRYQAALAEADAHAARHRRARRLRRRLLHIVRRLDNGFAAHALMQSFLETERFFLEAEARGERGATMAVAGRDARTGRQTRLDMLASLSRLVGIAAGMEAQERRRRADTLAQQRQQQEEAEEEEEEENNEERVGVEGADVGNPAAAPPSPSSSSGGPP